jgi:hypothetical protein
MSDIVHRLRDWRNLHLALGGKLFEAAADEIERLRLTDAEREAIEWYADFQNGIHAATLRNLLERMT